MVKKKRGHIQSWLQARKSRLTGLVVPLIMVVLGLVLLQASKAASPVLSVEPEAGIASSGAIATTDATASGGAAVKFAAKEEGNTAALSLLPTFSSVGMYWQVAHGPASSRAAAQYRVAGTSNWSQAQDLWYDERALGGRPAEYRGSIVGLKPGTTYEIRLAISGTATSVTKRVATWTESFPVAKRIELPSSSTQPLDLTGEIGSAAGYILVTGPGGGPATIDVRNNHAYNIQLSNSSYVIIRGLTLKGAREHGIRLGATTTDDVHDIVLERNTISGWGTADTSGFGVNLQSGVYSNTDKLTRVIVQGNQIQHPRTGSNNWSELHNGSYHPAGPQGITFRRGLGSHVIRYNDIVGTSDRRFNDAMGATGNFSYNGFPGRDSDVYGNYIAYAWDDGIEAEGAGMNVRIWDNYLTEVYHAFGLAAVSLGPTYAYRNVQEISRRDNTATWGGSMFKMGGNTRDGVFYGDGRVYLFHNISLKPASGPEVRKPVEATDGRILRSAVTRNNILQTGASSGTPSIDDNAQSDTNSYDHDLYNGLLDTAPGAEANGIKGAPVHASGWGMDHPTRTGGFWIASNSPGYDKGLVLHNFNDGFSGVAPDMGPHEAGTPRRQYGAGAFQ